MNATKIKLTIIMLTMVLSLHGFIRNAYAPPGGGSPGTSPSWNYNPSPVTLPPQVPSWFSHGFPNVWSTDEVIKTLNENGLEVHKTSVETEPGNLPAIAKEIVKFSVSLPGEEWEGTILSFELKDNLNKVRNYYLGLNGRGELYTWSFVKGNILLVLPGNIAEEKAKQYKNALNNMMVE